MTTADNLLTFLSTYDLTQEGPGKWRCNSPLRASSNSHAFTLDLDPDGEHGVFFDHVSDENGTLYQLCDQFGIPKSSKPVVIPSTKRSYANLDDYAQAHGVCGDVFRSAGWKDDYWFAQPSLSFSTPNGPRYRLIDGSKDTYIQAGGYKACLYGLATATSLGSPLVLCNGEASVVVAQHYGVPAFCQNMGEKKLTTKNLTDLLSWYPPGEMLIALDCDDKGRKVAREIAVQLDASGYATRALDLGGSSGFDLADFCRLWQAGTRAALGKLPDLPGGPSPAPTIPPIGKLPFDPVLVDANASDAGNAEALSTLYGHMFRFDHTRKHGWYMWDGSHWKPDITNEIARFALMTTRARYAAAATIPNLDARRKLANWAITSESITRQRAILEIAQSHPPFSTTIDVFDRNVLVAGLPRTTLNLKDVTVHAPDPAQYISMQLGTRYNDAAMCPTWLQFIHDIFSGDSTTIAFVQRAIGYSLTGDTSEQKMFLCYGEGTNGKSVLLKTLMALLGDYAGNASFATFDGDHRSESTNDLAKLRGKRFVTIIETNEDRRLDEAKVKAVTGGDPISCRFLYGEFFTYTPTYKIWLAMNHKPVIRGTDRGIWRRIVLIPFLENFEPRKDKHLDQKLLTELPGILNWALDGLKSWHKEGLGSAPSIDAATVEYQRESDNLGTWMVESTVVDPYGELISTDAYTDYADWVKGRGERYPMTQTTWGRGLAARGFQSVRKRVGVRQVIVYLGIRLRTMNDP